MRKERNERRPKKTTKSFCFSLTEARRKAKTCKLPIRLIASFLWAKLIYREKCNMTVISAKNQTAVVILL